MLSANANAKPIAHATPTSALRTLTNADRTLIPLAVKTKTAEAALQELKSALVENASATPSRIARLLNAELRLLEMVAEDRALALSRLALAIRIALTTNASPARRELARTMESTACQDKDSLAMIWTMDVAELWIARTFHHALSVLTMSLKPASRLPT